MKIIEASARLESPPGYKELLQRIESAGRTCYKSEGKIKDGSAEPFIRGIIIRAHEAVLEHGSLTARFICDRGVSHEIVRHRIASYCQESTRYCRYSDDKFGNEITVVKPCFWAENSPEYMIWVNACKEAESWYFALMADYGVTPQEARSVLPTSLKTELVMTANIREWRHFLRLRTSPAAHPQIREVATMLLNEMANRYPVFFEDIGHDFQKV